MMCFYVIKKRVIRLAGIIFVSAFLCNFILLTSLAFANPTGSQIESGSATITTPTQHTVLIQQHSDKAIIHWQSFNIGTQEKTQFVQPSVTSVALNRINPNLGASQIFGNLVSNGQIILINQAGIFFASGAQINVGGIIARMREGHIAMKRTQ